MVQIAVGGCGEFQGSEADIVKSFVINDHAFISIFDELMNRKGGVVGLNDSIRYFW